MPVTVAVCSLFRNSAKTLDYFRGVLEAQVGDDLELIFSFIEGDSSDDTWARLQAWADADPRVLLGQMNVEPVQDFDDRVRKWAALGNATVDQLADRDYDYLLWCESDLTLPPDLLSWLVADDVDVVAPAVFLGAMFYDTWAFRGLDGESFQNTPPYHSSFDPHGLVELNSVGSTVLFKKAVIDAGVRFRGVYDNGLLVGFCNDSRQLGFKVFMDSRVSVIHPTSSWRAQQYEIGEVRLEGFDQDDFTRTIWTTIKQFAEKNCSLVLGSPALAEGHEVFRTLHEGVEMRGNGIPFAISSELLSESPKRFTLVIREKPIEVARCQIDSTQ